MILRIGSKSRLSVIGYRLSAKIENRAPKTEHRVANAEFGFTLVEVIISVAILGFGLAIIIRSFASAIIGIDSCQNYIKSLRFAQNKMNDLIADSYEKNGLSPEVKTGEIAFGNRKFSWQAEIEKISKPEYLTKDFVIAVVNLDWQERNISKNSTLVTYLPKKKEKKKEGEE